ncbi:PucR family transcriptional regulator [Planococcus sp. NCCP-2050]|uniref:PucR family transcriptional regulator n=1 Tax=Planococcus sp. NCCP-2050 TaxID=2944679 RepID=UPI00203B604E|nr:PucR family transcriptional regulator [Planococcus sp. NCCP-2050]GKW45304.1 hypothetical protein NCCP2050_09960 [Planococcus sp. NCCP-2050]
MIMEEALRIGELAKGVLIAGKAGGSREIRSIEVMEVPEVVSWINEGILVMTAFYSISENPDKQVEVLRTLIDKKAAGIVIKIGRFVNELPEEMIRLADESSFPIIALPKNVSYINVLTPLYERLYEEKKMKIDQSANPFSEFDDTDFPTVKKALNFLEKLTDSPVYIEDMEGKLLYICNGFQPDKWRNSVLLFSEPRYEQYPKVLEQWRIEFQTKKIIEFKMEGQRTRYIIPLVSKNNVFGTLHLLHKGQTAFEAITSHHIAQVGVSMAELILKEQLNFQKDRMQDLEALEKFTNGENSIQPDERALVLCFRGRTMDASNYPVMSLLDYSCLCRHWLQFCSRKAENASTLIFEKYQQYYALIVCKEEHYQKIIQQWIEIAVKSNEAFPDNGFRLAISQPFNHSKKFNGNLRSAVKTMEIGLKIQPKELVYSQDKLGVYEILFQLNEEPQVRNYIESVLGEISQADNELFISLKTYLEENGNVSRTAEKLFIHRRTMTYRLQKIQELLMMDLDNAEHRFILQFCIKLKELN